MRSIWLMQLVLVICKWNNFYFVLSICQSVRTGNICINALCALLQNFSVLFSILRLTEKTSQIILHISILPIWFLIRLWLFKIKWQKLLIRESFAFIPKIFAKVFCLFVKDSRLFATVSEIWFFHFEIELNELSYYQYKKYLKSANKLFL